MHQDEMKPARTGGFVSAAIGAKKLLLHPQSAGLSGNVVIGILLYPSVHLGGRTGNILFTNTEALLCGVGPGCLSES